MKLTLIISDNCETCVRTRATLISFVNLYSDIELIIQHINEIEINLAIVPALFINNELFCYGEIDKNQIDKILEINFAKETSGN